MAVEKNEFEELIGDFEFELDESVEVKEDEPIEDSESESDESDSNSSDADVDGSDESSDADDTNEESAEDDETDETSVTNDSVEEETEEPKEEEKSELEILKEQNRLLMEQLNKNIQDPVIENDGKSEEGSILDGVDAEELMDDPEAFKKFLADFEKSIREKAQKESESVVSSQVQNQLAMTRMVDRFYEDNPQLAGVKKYVGALAREVSSESPDKNYEDVLKDVAEKAYKNLGINRKAVQANPKKPSFAKAGSKANRAVKKEKSETEMQIDAIIGLEY